MGHRNAPPKCGHPHPRDTPKSGGPPSYGAPHYALLKCEDPHPRGYPNMPPKNGDPHPMGHPIVHSQSGGTPSKRTPQKAGTFILWDTPMYPQSGDTPIQGDTPKSGGPHPMGHPNAPPKCGDPHPKGYPIAPKKQGPPSYGTSHCALPKWGDPNPKGHPNVPPNFGHPNPKGHPPFCTQKVPLSSHHPLPPPRRCHCILGHPLGPPPHSCATHVRATRVPSHTWASVVSPPRCAPQ